MERVRRLREKFPILHPVRPVTIAQSADSAQVNLLPPQRRYSRLSGAVVKLYKDVNLNGQLDALDGAALGTKTTGADGTYAFTGLNTGSYLVVHNPGSNQVRTAPVLTNTIAVNATKKNDTYGGNAF